MAIKKLHIPNLHNEEIFQFSGEFKSLADESNIQKISAVKAPYTTFVHLYGRMGAGLEQVRKSGHTAKLAEADKLRDSMYRGLVLHVESCCHSPVAAKAEAARNIQIVIHTYGNFSERSYAEETGTVVNFVDTLRTRCSADVEQIGAGEWITALDEANRVFSRLMEERFDEHADEEHINIRETRRELEAVYGKITYLVDALVLLSVEAQIEYQPFIDRLNERIVYYRNVLAQRHGRNSKNSGKNGGEE